MPLPRSSPAPRALLAALSLVAAGCATSEAESCPGQTIGVFALQGRRVDPATACAAGTPDGWASSLPATVPAALEADPTASFTVTLSGDPSQGTAALCRGGQLAAVLIGTRTGDHVHVEAAAGTGVLAACGGCTAALTTVVDGDLLPGVDGGPPRFSGTWVERMDAAGGACGPCTLPCTATYAIDGVQR